MLADGLRQIDGVSVYCDPAPHTGVVSFRLDAGDVALTGTILDESFGIAVHPGLHCPRQRTRPSGLSPKEPCGSASANSTPAAMSTRSSPPSVKSGPCMPLINPFERRIPPSPTEIWRFSAPQNFGCFSVVMAA
jgi:hypothetical protein